MSRHSFTTTLEGRPVIVVVGYDRPLRGFFCFVEKCDADADADDECEDEFVYSNLNDLKLASCYGLSKSLDYFKGVLRDLGLQVPASMFEQSELDMRGNVGNRCVSHNENGEFA
jgi:hypothetical protein